MSERSWKFSPGTTLGRWSVGLIILMPILFVIGSSLSGTLYDSVPSGSTILADISSRPFLALSMLIGMAAGVTSFITGLLAIVKDKDRALLVYVSTVLGGLLIIYLVAEVAFPH